MALNRVDYPANLTAQADFSAHGTLIETGYLDKSFAPLLVLGGEIPQGIVLQIGGVVYRADSAETVTGTASKYVRVAPSGATATANYVTNLSGVSWNAQYNGYYDGSGNLYIFDENQALYDGAVATVKTRFVQQAEDGKVYIDELVSGAINTGQGANQLYPMNQGVRTTDDVTFNQMNGSLEDVTMSGLKIKGAIHEFRSNEDTGIPAQKTFGTLWSELAAAFPSAINQGLFLASGAFEFGGDTFIVGAVERVSFAGGAWRIRCFNSKNGSWTNFSFQSDSVSLVKYAFTVIRVGS